MKNNLESSGNLLAYNKDGPVPIYPSIPKIYTKIADAMYDIEAIAKANINKSQNFKYRGIDDIYNDLHPIFARHKLFTITEVLEEKSEEQTSKSGTKLTYRILKVKYTMYAEDGSSVSGIVIGEGMDSGDKASNKAMAIAHKYFLTQLFVIPTEDTKDPDGESYELIKKQNGQNKSTTHVNSLDSSSKIELCENLSQLREVFNECVEYAKTLNSPDRETYLLNVTVKKDKKKAEVSNNEII